MPLEEEASESLLANTRVGSPATASGAAAPPGAIACHVGRGTGAPVRWIVRSAPEPPGNQANWTHTRPGVPWEVTPTRASAHDTDPRRAQGHDAAEYVDCQRAPAG